MYIQSLPLNWPLINIYTCLDLCPLIQDSLHATSSISFVLSFLLFHSPTVWNNSLGLFPFFPPWLSRTVKTDLLSYLQVNKLAYQSVMDAGRRHKTFGLEAKDIITQATWSSMVPFPPESHRVTQSGTGRCCRQWICITAEELWTSRTLIFYYGLQANVPDLCPRRETLFLLYWTAKKFAFCSRRRQRPYLPSLFT